MLNIKYISEKAALNLNKKEFLFLAEIEGIKGEVNKKFKRQKLNLSIVLDISGSMGEIIYNNMVVKKDIPAHNQFPKLTNQLGCLQNVFERGIKTGMTKLELAKKAAINAVEKMNIGDYVSLVVFDDRVDVLFNSKELTETRKEILINTIKNISIRGGTDVHAGWFAGASEVAKTMKEKFINRVLILTDGVTYSGITDSKEICSNVNALLKKGISTTTFGVGSGFNEDLLQEMSEKGGGNFYYIKEEKDFDDVFSQEFSGLLNIAGTEIEIELQTAEGVKISKQLNNFLITDNKLVLSDISGGKKVSLLFNLESLIPKTFDIKTNFKVGVLVLTYKNESGNKVQTIQEIELPVMKTKKWEDLPYNQEVKVQEMLLVMAEEKSNAGKMALSGNIEGAKSLLRSASAMACSRGFTDDRITSSLNSLNDSVLNADTMSAGDFKKSVSYESYRDRTGKGI
jgi:Ca-activated chloride channel family protein